MKNYLMSNNKKIELTEEQVKEIENRFGFNRVKLSDIPIGKTFKVDDFEFIVLEQHGFETSIILKEFWKSTQFDGSQNDYKESGIRKDLNVNFYEKLSNLVGKENIVKHTVDLTADDGRTDYGNCDDYISLLTCEMYRKYVYVLEKYNPQKWWWLATPYSVKSNGWETAVRCVYCFGTLLCNFCYYSHGVRPFCILKSNIFVSK